MKTYDVFSSIQTIGKGSLLHAVFLPPLVSMGMGLWAWNTSLSRDKLDSRLCELYHHVWEYLSLVSDVTSTLFLLKVCVTWHLTKPTVSLSSKESRGVFLLLEHQRGAHKNVLKLVTGSELTGRRGLTLTTGVYSWLSPSLGK